MLQIAHQVAWMLYGAVCWKLGERLQPVITSLIARLQSQP